MRIATSTIYDNQTLSIDNLSTQYQSLGQQLSTGKSLNVPSDDPSQVSQDLQVRSTIAAENSDASNASGASNELTFTDSTLSSLTSLLQSARNLAVEGATDIIPNDSQRPLLGTQVAGLLNQALALSNSQYGGTYIFAGTNSQATPPVTPLGSPPTSIAFTGNNDVRSEVINGQNVNVGTTLQQAFNYSSTNGTKDVFTMLSTLRDTLNNEPASTYSQQPVNVTGVTIQGNGYANPTTLGQIATGTPPAAAPMTTVPLTADNSVPAGSYSIEIDGTNPSTGQPGSKVFSFTNATVLDDGSGTSVVGLINAQSATTGVTVAWNTQTQRLTFSSVNVKASPSFEVTDVPTPAPPAATAATSPSTFLKAFQVPTTGSVTNSLSTQLGDIDATINAVLSARATIGQQIQNLAATGNQLAVQSTDNTNTKMTYEDTNIAQATSQFTLTQTALQAAYATTTRLEGKTLMDFL